MTTYADLKRAKVLVERVRLGLKRNVSWEEMLIIFHDFEFGFSTVDELKNDYEKANELLRKESLSAVLTDLLDAQDVALKEIHEKQQFISRTNWEIKKIIQLELKTKE